MATSLVYGISPRSTEDENETCQPGDSFGSSRKILKIVGAKEDTELVVEEGVGAVDAINIGTELGQAASSTTLDTGENGVKER